MQRKYRKSAAAVLSAALTTAVPVASAASPAGAGTSTTYVARSLLGARSGRPRKFSRAARGVTLTLPTDVVAALQAIDPDISLAIVRAVQSLGAVPPQPRLEVMAYGNSAIIGVPPVRALKERLGIDLVPLHDGRALIAFDEDVTIHQLELRLRDALLDPALAPDDRPTFEALAEIVQRGRREPGVELAQRGIIVLHMAETPRAEGSEDTR